MTGSSVCCCTGDRRGQRFHFPHSSDALCRLAFRARTKGFNGDNSEASRHMAAVVPLF